MRIAIIGGGAAGLMCAATLAEADIQAEIFLIEKNPELGKKVLISGGGRCNVTTGITDVRKVLTKYPRGAKFLQKAMYQFPPAAVKEWFESHDVPLKIEEDLRVFPVSDDGSDVVGVFLRLFHQKRLQVLSHHQVIRIDKDPHGYTLHVKGKPDMRVDVVVLTTGGQAYRQTGSTGDGYAFAESLGHTITSLAPSLNAFITIEQWPKQLAGVSWERAGFSTDRNPSYQALGPFLFTHRGVTGPAVFAFSSQVAFEAYDPQNPLVLKIDLFPDTDLGSFHKQLFDLAHEHGKKSLQNVLSFIIPRSVVETCLSLLKIDPDQHAAEVKKDQVQAIAGWLKAIPLHAISRAAGDEFVTAGGVETSEVDPSTMESKISPGLYFAGEILNIDGFTGGFNLQASWATGRLAGQSIISSLDQD